MWVDSGSNNNAIRPNEGTIYDRITKQGITTSSHAGNKGYYFYTSGSTAYGATDYWWLRSADRVYRDSACRVNISGDWGFSSTGSGYDAVAPGFVIGQ